MKKIDLTKLNNKTTFKIANNQNFLIKPNLLENAEIKKKCLFLFNKSNLKSKIIYKCVAGKSVDLDLEITLSTTEKKIQNVEVFLEVYILNLHEGNKLTIKPFLEIPNKDIKFEHKVTIGAPNENWVKYLTSRGLNNRQTIKLIFENFITG